MLAARDSWRMAPISKRLTQNGTGTVLGVISMSWAEAARFALVHQKNCCAISAASILSCFAKTTRSHLMAWRAHGTSLGKIWGSTRRC
jgi:hypothetical protein